MRIFFNNDYLIEINNKLKNTSKKYNIPNNSPSEKENTYAYNTCKKTFCNKKCEGYDFYGDKERQIDFKKEIIDGFQSNLSKNKIEMLKKEEISQDVLISQTMMRFINNYINKI